MPYITVIKIHKHQNSQGQVRSHYHLYNAQQFGREAFGVYISLLLSIHITFSLFLINNVKFSYGAVVKNLPANAVFLPGKFHGQRSWVGYRSWGRKKSDTTEHE